MRQIKKPIKIIIHYVPIGYGYGGSNDGFLSMTVNNSNAGKYSTPIKGRDMSIKQLAQYIEMSLLGYANEAEENNDGE